MSNFGRFKEMSPQNSLNTIQKPSYRDPHEIVQHEHTIKTINKRREITKPASMAMVAGALALACSIPKNDDIDRFGIDGAISLVGLRGSERLATAINLVGQNMINEVDARISEIRASGSSLVIGQ